MTDSVEPDGIGSTATDAAPVVAMRALAAPAIVDRTARTVEVVWSTGARARNVVPPLGPTLEEFDMAPAAVRMNALRSGRGPVLDTHRRGGARDVLGRVTAARIEGGCGYATLQFSSAADVEPVWQRLADGTLQSVSVGYRVHRYEPQRTRPPVRPSTARWIGNPTRSPSCRSRWTRPQLFTGRTPRAVPSPPSNPP